MRDDETTSIAGSTAPLLASVRDAGKLLAMGNNSVYEALADGRLEAKKWGTRTLITMASIRALAESLPPATFRPPQRKAPERKSLKSK